MFLGAMAPVVRIWIRN